MKKYNIFKNNVLTLFLFFIICIVSILIIMYSYKNSKYNNTNINTPTLNSSNTIEFVISRYNEDLSWTTEYPFNKYKYIVYNKGGNNDNYVKTNVLHSYKIKNEGKCDHTYLYHIVHNYEKLSDIVVFLPGCINECYFKFTKTKILFELIKKYNEAFFIVDYYTKSNILDEYYYFKVDNYKSMSKSNLVKNENIDFRKSKIRPFGKWYEINFHYNIQHISLFGIMSINKKDIYNHEKQYYYKFMKSLEGAINDELSHYVEKSWEAIFYPLKNTYLLYYTNSITNITSKIITNYIKLYKDKYALDLSSSPLTGPLFWNLIYFINRNTYLNYNITKNVQNN